MTDDLEDLKRRLVVGHKRDGRSVYNEAAKSELVGLCLLPGASVSRLARECGVNANQVSRWLREHGHQHRPRRGISGLASTPSAAFVSVPVLPSPPPRVDGDDEIAAPMMMQARLPNGVAIDLRGVDQHNVVEVIEALGRLRCSASTKA